MSAPAATLAQPFAIQLGPEVILVDAPDRSGWLLDLQGSFFALNRTAVRLVRAALDGDPGVVRELAAGQVAVEQVRADQEALLGQLLARGLLSPAGQSSRQTTAPRWAIHLVRLVAGRRPDHRRLTRLLLLAWVLLRTIGWRRTLVAMRIAVSNPDGTAVDGFNETLAAAVRSAVANCPVWVSCKERALASAAVAWAAGQPAPVILGVTPYPFASHAWCEVHGQIVSDPPDRVEAFERVSVDE